MDYSEYYIIDHVLTLLIYTPLIIIVLLVVLVKDLSHSP